jgi:gluconolactonase
VAGGLGFPEGPLLLPSGAVAFVEEFKGQISVLQEGQVGPLAVVGGNPNGLALSNDGLIYVTRGAGRTGDRRVTPSIVVVDRDSGSWEIVTTEADGRALRAPNDLCFGPDGALYFTDPDAFDPTDDSIRGWVCRNDGHKTEILAELPNVHPNGIAFGPNGDLFWVESLSRRIVWYRNGQPEIVTQLEPPSLPDGCAFTTDGCLVIATLFSGGIHAVRLEDIGGEAELISWADDLRTTNVAFEGKTLWVTDAGLDYERIDNPSGRLWRLETESEGLSLRRGS